MRKLSLILAVLLLTAPAWATVTITCEQVDDTNEVIVSYEVTGEPNKVRAFALDITLDNDVNITDVNTSANVDYTIFPGSVAISGGEVTDEGQAVADPCDYPPDTQPGLGSSGVTIEMGGLWSPPNDEAGPPDSNVLLSFFTEEIDCNVTITVNAARGGVVMTKASTTPDVTSPGVGAVPTYPVRFPGPECLVDEGDQEYDDWVEWGKPDCWCYKYQCRGDADDGLEFGTIRVLYDDVAILAEAVAKDDTALALVPNGICADFDHGKEFGTIRVLYNDVAVLATYVASQDIPACDEAPLPTTGPWNFWKTAE